MEKFIVFFWYDGKPCDFAGKGKRGWHDVLVDEKGFASIFTSRKDAVIGGLKAVYKNNSGVVPNNFRIQIVNHNTRILDMEGSALELQSLFKISCEECRRL